MGHRPGIHVCHPGGPEGITVDLRVFAPAGTPKGEVRDAAHAAMQEAWVGISLHDAWPEAERTD